jgi:hypothetical protein
MSGFCGTACVGVVCACVGDEGMWEGSACGGGHVERVCLFSFLEGVVEWNNGCVYERGVPMILRAEVLSGEVRESIFYDQATGQEKPSFAVELTVLDVDTEEKYTCQLTDGFPRLEELKELRRQGQPPDVLRQVADALRQELPPRRTLLTLEVVKFKGKSAAFLKLVCRLPQAASVSQ